MKRKVLVVHGPNLNLLGEREPEIYGTVTMAQINRDLKKTNGVLVRCFQANGEGEIIDFLHKHRRWADGIVINPAAFTHYSYAIRDAIASIALPAVEVHLSDIKKREPFRRKSVIKAVCIAQVSGLGPKSYSQGMKVLLTHLRDKSPKP